MIKEALKAKQEAEDRIKQKELEEERRLEEIARAKEEKVNSA